MPCSRHTPPEYIKKNFISQKFDIFSLGVIIIEIMAGHEGYNKKAKMSSQEFVDLVRKFVTSIPRYINLKIIISVRIY